MRKKLVAFALLSVMLTGCAPFIGSPSASLMTRDVAVSGQFEPVAGRVKRSECFRWVLVLFLFGTPAPTHEGALARLLEEYQADVLLDADLSTSIVPFPYLFLQSCASVEGVPARRVGMSAESASRPTGRKG